MENFWRNFGNEIMEGDDKNNGEEDFSVIKSFLEYVSFKFVARKNRGAKIETDWRIDKRLINKRGMSKLELVMDESAFRRASWRGIIRECSSLVQRLLRGDRVKSDRKKSF